MGIKEKIIELKKSEISKIVNQRLKEFKSFETKNELDWFSELCFCLLTANSKAITAINIQNKLKGKGFLDLNQEELSKTIKDNNHRFCNNKAKYIVLAREYSNIKNIVQKLVKIVGEKKTRDYLAETIKGIGYKEASHFLRNTGHNNVAILDRHILRTLFENNYIKEIPKTLTKKKYHEFENILETISKELNMNQAELDLYMWYLKTGKVLK